jgi:hypothetical protein
MALCRLWQAQGKAQQARERLETLYGWFTEGRETPELQKVRALLVELG